MKVRLFALPVSEHGEIDTRAIDAFGEKSDVIQVWEHVAVAGQRPVWLVMLATHGDSGADRRDRAAGPTRRPSLPAPDEPLFTALRDWRNARARKAGVPPYVIMNNRQIEAVAAARPTTLEALGAIPGMGPARLEDYGAEILAVVAACGPENPPEPATDE